MIALNWRAVVTGFVVTLVIGLLSGMTISAESMALPTVGWGLTGLLGGVAAGYVAGGGFGNGAVNGIVGTTLGALIVGVVSLVLGTLFFGLVGLAVVLTGFLFIGLYAIPGAVGGAIGAMAKGRTATPVGRPAGR